MDIPGLLQHFMARGSEGRDIFLDDGDRRLFLGGLERLSRLRAEADTGMLGIKAKLPCQRNRVKVLAVVRAVILPRFSHNICDYYKLIALIYPNI
jgi:hypothetical protein